MGRGGVERANEIKNKSLQCTAQTWKMWQPSTFDKKKAPPASNLHNCRWPKKTRYDSAPLKQHDETTAPFVNRWLPTPRMLHWKIGASSRYTDQGSSTYNVFYRPQEAFWRTGMWAWSPAGTCPLGREKLSKTVVLQHSTTAVGLTKERDKARAQHEDHAQCLDGACCLTCYYSPATSRMIRDLGQAALSKP